MEGFFTWFESFMNGYGAKILEAALILVLGFLAVKLLVRLSRRWMKRFQFDPSLSSFVVTIIKILLEVVVVISALASLGVSTASLVTALGAVGVAVSLAVKDSLANVAGGMVILFSKPFLTDEFVAVGSLSGTVKKIDIIHTTLTTADGLSVVIPNGQMVNEKIVNYSREPLRRLDLTFSIGYGDDMKQAIRLIKEEIARHPKTLSDPAPIVRVSEHADSCIRIAARVWCRNEDYFDLMYDMNEGVKTLFDREGISIPFPQLDVHIVKD